MNTTYKHLLISMSENKKGQGNSNDQNAQKKDDNVSVHNIMV